MIGSRKSRPSATALDQALRDAGYRGPRIIWGYSGTSYRSNVINRPEAIALAANKRLALECMRDAGVPVLLTTLPVNPADFPVVARPDYHMAGKNLYICPDEIELGRVMRLSKRDGTASRKRATHAQRYLANAREFRVHIVHELSIKVSEKVGSGNHATGATFGFPVDFGHRVTLRDIAKRAVTALGLDFGAVDILWNPDGLPYVLEVNTAPRLTDPTSDTLSRYVRAFVGSPDPEPDGTPESG